MTNWLKFANTIKLRLAIRESTNPTLAADEATLVTAVKATQSLGYIDANSDAATVNPGYLNNDANGGQQSPLWLNYGTTQTGGGQTDKSEFQANSFATNFFASNNDPRLIQVYSGSTTPNITTATGISAGASLNVQNGIGIVSTAFGVSQPPSGTINGTVVPVLVPSLVGPGMLKSPTMNATIMSAAESWFLQSEAAAKGIISGDPATFYNNGITASFEDDMVPNADAAATTYYNQAAIKYPAGGTIDQQVAAIITQKWAALDVYGAFEAFNEERRTGIPNVPTSVYNGANAPNQVTRILYPFIEYETNSTNVTAQGAIGKFTSKIFWAK